MSMRQLKISSSITNRESVSFGKYMQEIAKVRMLTPEEEVDLCQKIREGNKDALDKLVKSNLRFVVSVAKQYQGQGLSLCDLVNEGNIGLIHAARKFDDTRGFRFISFAVWWIRQEILHAISQKSQIIRVPFNKTVLFNKIKKIAVAMEQQLDRLPSTDELAEEMNMTTEEIDEMYSISGKHVSLDSPVGEEEENGSLLDIMVNLDTENAETQLQHTASLRTEIWRHLGILTDRQKETICYFFGIGLDRSLSLEDIGRKFDLTPERVRQIKDKALQKLKAQGNFQVLRSYL
jgi:RNA polymerase primary sigma factor